MASAQEFRATITGLVTDPSGAPVAGAKVEVRSVERQSVFETETNESGRYLTRFLAPGDYTLAVTKDGFKKAVREAFALSAADRLSIDIALQLGAVADSITVSGDVPLLSTETASRSAVIEQKFVDNLPTSGRNLYQLLFSQPGVIKTSRYWGSFELYAFGNINGISINGGRSGENETLIDGISSVRASRSASFAPALNSIQEVTVLTNSYDAQYGRFGGGVTSVTLRTGTNRLHGQLFEFFKNDNLNANGYSRNSLGLKQPEFKNNTFGFTVDGPVFIPKVFDGRNKMFFMVSLEGLRERNPQTQLWTVPTALELGGDFSRTLDNAGRMITMYDPTTTRASGSATIRTPFAGNRIPAQQINPVAAKAASFYPKPNRVSESLDGQNNYLFVNSSKNFYDQWLGKMDWNLTSRHRVSGRYGETPWYNFARVQWGTNAAEPSSEYPSTRISRNWGLDWTWTLSPTSVFNLRAGLARYEGFSGNTFGKDYDPRELGFPSALVSQFVGLQFPRFNLSGNNFSPLGATQTSGYESQDTYSLQPNMQVYRGKHALKFGAEARLYNQNAIRPASASGNYTFGRNWTQADPQRADAASGNVFATFLLGYPTSGYVDRNMDPAYQNSYFALFFQDDWKIARNVTLNLGFRWDYEGPIAERYNRQVRGFAFDQASPIQSQVQGLTVKGGLLYAGSSGADRLAFNRDWNNFQPRAGIAWQIQPKTVLRGGYGLFMMGQSASGPDTGFSRRTDMIVSTDNNLTPAANLSDPFPRSLFPTGLLQPIGSSQGLATNLGLGIGAQILNRPLPYSHQFSFGFQRALPFQWVADVSYVGNLTRKLPVSANLNFIPTAELTRLPVAERAAYFNAQVANPLRGLLPGSAFNGATVPRQQLLAAYPHFQQVGISNLPIGGQSYHSLQAKATRRYSRGFAMQASYTWSKSLERVASLNAQDVTLGDLTQTGLEQRLVEFDIPHTLSAAFSYELPFGKGRPFLKNMGGWGNAVFGGWNINAQYMIRSGQPIDFPNASPTAARSAKLTSSQRDELAKKQGRSEFNPFFDKWFDTSLFPTQARAPFTLVDAPTRFPDVRSPYLESWEFSAYKEFRIREAARVQLRADFQNALDYAYFGRLVARPNNVQDPRFGQLDPAQDNQPRVVVLVLKVLF
ncbi:MAG: TonB-dependent receptor [Acidobacteria bacterium]|nr:TonB-dependent receptor [Acidobacteriota bacterium]